MLCPSILNFLFPYFDFPLNLECTDEGSSKTLFAPHTPKLLDAHHIHELALPDVLCC